MPVFREIIGTEGDDRLAGKMWPENHGENGADYIDGRGGNDRLNGRVGSDYILGGDGNDTILGDQGSDTIFGGAGDDIIKDIAYEYEYGWWGRENNEIHGGAGNDRIIVAAYTDLFSAPASLDNRVYGDDGDDVIRVSYASGYFDGGSGNDRIVLEGYVYTSVVHGGDGNDRIFLSGDVSGYREAVYAYGDDGDDVIYAAPRALIDRPVDWDKYSPGGNQIIDGGAGNDRIFCFSYTQDTIVMDFDGGRDVVRNFETNAHIDPGSDYGPIDLIDFTAFSLDMTAEEFIATRVTDRGDRVILHPDDSATLVIWGVDPEDLVNSLLL